MKIFKNLISSSILASYQQMCFTSFSSVCIVNFEQVNVCWRKRTLKANCSVFLKNFINFSRSYSVPYFLAFGLNTERYVVSLCIQSECGKIRTRIISAAFLKNFMNFSSSRSSFVSVKSQGYNVQLYRKVPGRGCFTMNFMTFLRTSWSGFPWINMI